MVPIPSLFQQQHHDGGVGAGGGGASGDYCDTGRDGKFCRFMSRIGASEYEYDDEPCSEACVGSEQVGFGIGHNHMAEDDSRTRSRNGAGSSKGGGPGGGGAFHQEEQEEPRDDEGSWLQLGIGSGGGGGCQTDPTKLEDPLESTGTRRSGLVELDLKPPGGGSYGGSSTSSAGAQEMVVNKASDPTFTMKEFRAFYPPTTTPPPPPPPLFLLQYQHPHPQPRPAASSLTSLIFPHQSEVDWGYNRAPNPNPPWTPSPSSPSSSSATPAASSSMLPAGPYYARLFQLPSLDVAGPSSSSSCDVVRVIDAPSRPHSGVWFVLEASKNQAKEPFLPQIPKSFLRIKDGRMTVLLLMKYLVNKLRLDNESEVEITCRGEQLPPMLTLQDVRDKIWSRRREAVTLLPDSSTSATDHLVMILHYGRTASSF